jgi:hypothetical protein
MEDSDFQAPTDHTEREHAGNLRTRLPVNDVQVGAFVGCPQSCRPRADLGVWCPRQDSNLRHRLRRAVLYPLSYGGWGRRRG